MADMLSWVETEEDEDLEVVPLGDRMHKTKYYGRSEKKETPKERRKAKKRAKQERLAAERREKMETVTEEDEEEENDGARGKVMKSAVVVLEDIECMDVGDEKESEKDGDGTKQMDEDILQINESDDDDVRTYAGVVKGGPTSLDPDRPTTSGLVRDIRDVLHRKCDGANGPEGSLAVSGRKVKSVAKEREQRSVWASVKRIKSLMDELEDEGARRDLVRKVRMELDEVLELATELSEKDAGKMKEDGEVEESERAEKEVRDEPSRPAKQEQKRKVIFKRVEVDEPKEKRKTLDKGQWLNERIGDITPEDLQVQIYEGAYEWTLEAIRHAFWTMGRLSDDGIGRGELDRWRIVKRQRTGADESNYILKVPLRSYRSLMKVKDPRVKIEGKWVRYGRYIDLPTCWNCSGYGHMRGACKGPECCRKCGGAHLPTDCRAETLCCVHCKDLEMDGTEHRAVSAECATHMRLLDEKRRRVVEYVESL